MFAICIEASHSKGMGHLFRMLNFTNYLKKQNEKFVFIINDNDKTKNILKTNNILFEVVDLNDMQSDWEIKIIENYNISFWTNDRLDTDERHSLKVQNKGVKLITLDDLGSGAKFSDINICGLFFKQKNLEGKKILKGVKYLILNPEIDKYKKTRSKIDNILVTLGGSDTYGVTIKVLKLLKNHNIKATIHVGISFAHFDELKRELTPDYKVITYVPSFIEGFSKYDLAITGGGITPFEANASGLPCLVVANEYFEIPNCEFLESLGCSKFIGHHVEIDSSIFSKLNFLNIKSMSSLGMQNISTNAANNIYSHVMSL